MQHNGQKDANSIHQQSQKNWLALKVRSSQTAVPGGVSFILIIFQNPMQQSQRVLRQMLHRRETVPRWRRSSSSHREVVRISGLHLQPGQVRDRASRRPQRFSLQRVWWWNDQEWSFASAQSSTIGNARDQNSLDPPSPATRAVIKANFANFWKLSFLTSFTQLLKSHTHLSIGVGV